MADIDTPRPEPTPVTPAPVATPKVAAPPALAAQSGAGTTVDTQQKNIAAAKQKVQLLTWAASKLASEGSPGTAATQAKADKAAADFER